MVLALSPSKNKATSPSNRQQWIMLAKNKKRKERKKEKLYVIFLTGGVLVAGLWLSSALLFSQGQSNSGIPADQDYYNGPRAKSVSQYSRVTATARPNKNKKVMKVQQREEEQEVKARKLHNGDGEQSDLDHLYHEEKSPPVAVRTTMRLKHIQTAPPLPPEEDMPVFNQTTEWATIISYDSPLKDKTVPWRKNVHRAWLDFHNPNRTTEQQPPPAMLVLTKYGWNQRNQWKARRFIRSQRQRGLLEGVMNHAWFHPLEWDDIEQKRRAVPRPKTRYYVFMDVETCGDINYPYYLNRTANLDQIGGRGRRGTFDHGDIIQQALQHPIMKAATKEYPAKLILFDCNGRVREDGRENYFWMRNNNPTEDRWVLVSVSARPQDHLKGVDMGLPPGPCTKCDLSLEELAAIDDCRSEQERPYLLTFAGNFRSEMRRELKALHNGKDILIGSPDEMQQWHLGGDNESPPPPPSSSESVKAASERHKHSYRTMAQNSQFAAVPRGDNLFSYRFAEVAGCGAIPVVYADDWILPFGPELVATSEYVVVIREDNVHETRAILEAISVEERCRMRRKAVEVYELYMKTGEGVIRGIVETLERRYSGQANTTTVAAGANAFTS